MPRERSLTSGSFLGLLFTQFLGATNDNILRWLVIGIGKHYYPPGHVSRILALGTAVFVLPYILLAAPAGYLADRFSKRRVIVVCKVAEILIMALAIVGIFTGNNTKGAPYLARFSRDVGSTGLHLELLKQKTANRAQRLPHLAKNARDMGHPLCRCR